MTPTKLKKTRRKIMLNSGQGYTYKTGQNMKGKKVGEIIKAIAPKRLNLLVIKIAKKCSEKVTNQDSEEIFCNSVFSGVKMLMYSEHT